VLVPAAKNGMNPSSTVDDSRTCFNMLAPKIARTRLRLQSSFPILASVQTPEPFEPEDEVTVEPARPGPPRTPQPRLGGSSFWALGARLTWLSGLLLAVSAFTDWYAGSGDGITIAVTGWHTGTLGKLVFFIGLAVLALFALREAGIELPATLPESLLVIALGALATIFVLIRAISIPDQFPGSSRGIGIWISLISALAVIAAGLLTASEEL
jgi:hypothetical protein